MSSPHRQSAQRLSRLSSVSSQRFPRFLTFQPGERESYIREKLGLSPDAPLPVEKSIHTTSTSGGNAARGSRLLKSHSCEVTYPDGTSGTCRYTRGGPAWHVFQFEHRDCLGASSLPVQYSLDRLENTHAAIETKVRELAALVFAKAVSREQREYFCRASEGGGRKARPECFQMSAKRAKDTAGKYALCIQLGRRLVPVTLTCDTLYEANAAWEERNDPRFLVACCNRLDRCWELPRYSSLYRLFDPRKREGGAQ
jgi:hypothetical protein